MSFVTATNTMEGITTLQTDFDIRRKYMETIDLLEAAKKLMDPVDGVVSSDIYVVLEGVKASASRVAYRIERKEWEDGRGNN